MKIHWLGCNLKIKDNMKNNTIINNEGNIETRNRKWRKEMSNDR